MKQYYSYLKYVLRHKSFVNKECMSLGYRWRGLIHDMSKFLPSEYIPYANHFYNKDGSKREVRDKSGFYDPNNTGDKKFDKAWLFHQKRNKHHWQYWVLPKDDGSIKVLEMPQKYLMEMICDWVGAGKAQGYLSPKEDPYYETRKWYNKNKDKMQLHENTRRIVERKIGY